MDRCDVLLCDGFASVRDLDTRTGRAAKVHEDAGDAVVVDHDVRRLDVAVGVRHALRVLRSERHGLSGWVRVAGRRRGVEEEGVVVRLGPWRRGDVGLRQHIVVHGLEGLAGPGEEAEHDALVKAGVVDDVGMDRVLDIAVLVVREHEVYNLAAAWILDVVRRHAPEATGEEAPCATALMVLHDGRIDQAEHMRPAKALHRLNLAQRHAQRLVAVLAPHLFERIRTARARIAHEIHHAEAALTEQLHYVVRYAVHGHGAIGVCAVQARQQRKHAILRVRICPRGQLVVGQRRTNEVHGGGQVENDVIVWTPSEKTRRHSRTSAMRSARSQAERGPHQRRRRQYLRTSSCTAYAARRTMTTAS